MKKFFVLLTGATGFLGTQISRQILLQESVELITLVRASDQNDARERLRREWWDWPELRTAVEGGRVRVLVGDVTLEHLGLDETLFAELAARLTHIIHSAADVRLFEPIETLRRVNVDGTRHILELAQAAHGLLRFAHVSTAYVAGASGGKIGEDELDNSYGFSNPYEQSKYEAELLVRQAASELPVSVFRPGMIVGDSSTGAVKSFNTLYYPLRLYLTGSMRVAPAKPSLRINLVPVDYVAQAVVKLTFDSRAAGLTFHLTPPREDQPSLTELIDLIRRWAREKMALSLPRPFFIPIPGLEKLSWLFEKGLKNDLALIGSLLPYFQKQPYFLRTNSDRLLGPYPHRWQTIMPPLLDFAVQYSFWHRTSRTVHEQIFYRLQSRRKPVTYHDLVKGKDFTRTAAEVRAEIEAAVSALRILGVAPGDRVALVGLNSSRYFSALVACGLCGAVSVPLYVTCPPEEMHDLLSDCGTRLFLVGVPSVLARLDKIQFEGQVISFCRENVPAPIPQKVMDWQTFLSLGEGRHDPLPRQALDAPAALYYTSGTTGHPKGVLFQHSHLRWAAETLGSMYPWHERNHWGSYLSYLPMNHIVEGVLACYSPYFVPASLDIYYLERFDDLQQALKHVRPTIFFSVPRFFEKVRSMAMENPLTQIYRSLPETGLRHRLVGHLLRGGLLRKAGLDGARMMIVGSAPSDPDLLAFFDDLGVEISDAYGLTEAPLVTLNRLGRNRMGTLGESLPETEIRIEPDGEIRVRGPQVAPGYIENGVLMPFVDGWLDTGDLGRVSEDGYLIMDGRKKDLIITSYAKNIFPAPIEAGLRTIPGVAEARLVGEGRPYCAALIWMESDTWGEDNHRALDAGVAAVNERLSHPEQVKRWVVLAGGLTAENGDLTGSMKIKRNHVTKRLALVIDDLYQGKTPPGALYCGGLRRDA
jgi:long-chain acyl-CoA synthetase